MTETKSTTVSPEQRFSKTHPCPTCGGYASAARGQGIRCFGFLSEDGEWARCTREEYGGTAPYDDKSGAYVHKLRGNCKCGTSHGSLEDNVRPIKPRAGKKRAGDQPITATYDYVDEAGELLYQVVRYEDPKDFKQRRHNNKGGWVWSVAGVRRVLYRLPKILKADPSQTVYICEGEKDVERLEAEGLLATTNAQGAKKWLEAFSEPLEERSVVILPDNDKDGRTHAELVARSLSGKAASVKVLELPGLPEGGDASDYLEAGGTIEQLELLAQDAPEWEGDTRLSPFTRADLTQALRDGVEPPEALVPGIVLKGRVHSIFSAGGTGKTFKMLYLVKRVIEQGFTVLIFDMENGLRIIAERLEVLGVTPEQSELIYYYPFPQMPLEESTIRAFEELLDEIDPALVVFDSWVNCLAACGLDENSSIDIATWADAYPQRARSRDIASLILDHVPKEGNTARGSGRKLDYVDVQWELRNPQPFNRKNVGRIDLHLRKDREGWLPGLHTFSVGGGEEGFIFKASLGLLLQVNEEGLLPTDKTVKDALASFVHSGAKDKEWKEASNARGIARSTYYHSRKTLLEKGHVEQVMGKYFIKYLQNDESNEVQNSPIGLLDHGGEGSPNGPTTLGVGPLDLHPDTPSVDEEDSANWIEGEV